MINVSQNEEMRWNRSSLWHVSLFRGKCAFQTVSMYKNKSKKKLFLALKLKSIHIKFMIMKSSSLCLSYYVDSMWPWQPWLCSCVYLYTYFWTHSFCGGIGRSQDEKDVWIKLCVMKFWQWKLNMCKHTETREREQTKRDQISLNVLFVFY